MRPCDPPPHELAAVIGGRDRRSPVTPEDIVARRTGRRCLALPSNRLGLYLALRHWCRPGQRLLMSPLSADEILFLVLAAGLRPVIAPLSPRDGNIDAGAVDLDRIDAVLTTNLYGLPDRVAAFAGKILIEDVAHAIETTVGGRPLGIFGVAGVFSLSKHAGAGSGGVLAVEHEADLRALRARTRPAAPAGRPPPGDPHHPDLGRPAHRAAPEPGPARAARDARAGHGGTSRRSPHRPASGRPGQPRCARPPGSRPSTPGSGRTCTTTGPGSAPCHGGTRCGGCAPCPTGAPSASRGSGCCPGCPPWPRPSTTTFTSLSSGCRCWSPTGTRPSPRWSGTGSPPDTSTTRPTTATCPASPTPRPTPEIALWWGRHVLPVDPLYAHRALPVVERLAPASPLLPTASSGIA